MKRVLIITYYWVPSGGAGVQRWVKFTKYLREFGWEPVIFTPENPEYPSIDESFQKDIPAGIEIIKTPIWEPYNIYRNLTGKKGEAIPAGFITENKKQGWKEKLSISIRGNFLIPDPRRFWVKPSVKFLHSYLNSHPVDAIVTTGPPHSMHLIALQLKKYFPALPWIADFRDPWTNIDFYRELNLTYPADLIHHRLERKVVQNTDMLTVVSGGMLDEFRLMKPKQIQMIPNGYDDEDINLTGVKMDEKFTISHIGTLNAARNPKQIWKALAQLCADNENFKRDLQIQLIGKTDFQVLEDIRNSGLEDLLLKIDYLPHAEAILKQQTSQLLLLLINNTANAKGILTGKFFEYLASKRPILAVGPTDGDAAAILNESGAGKMVNFDDLHGSVISLQDFYQQYKANKLQPDLQSVEKYSRKNLTGQLAQLLNQLTYHA